MPTEVHTFKDGERIYFDRGKFDEWCVYRQLPGEKPKPPLDKDYFAELLRFGEKYGHKRVYRYFLEIYDLTDKERRYAVFKLIGEQGKSLDEADYLPYAKLMVTLYYAMIAEENRQPENRFPLKKKVKKIGVFQILIEDLSPEVAANFSKNKQARKLRDVLAGYERKERELGL